MAWQVRSRTYCLDVFAVFVAWLPDWLATECTVHSQISSNADDGLAGACPAGNDTSIYMACATVCAWTRLHTELLCASTLLCSLLNGFISFCWHTSFCRL